MNKLSLEEIRSRFESSKEFNEIFDAFEHAIGQHVDDIELYKVLFWNQTLTPNELCLFGEKLAKELPGLAYSVYMWLANVFEVTYSTYDNHELAFAYFQKAAGALPASPDPYLEAAACHETDLNIPPLSALIDFLRTGSELVKDPVPFYEKLIHCYELSNNDEMTSYYRRKLRERSSSSERPPEQ